MLWQPSTGIWTPPLSRSPAPPLSPPAERRRREEEEIRRQIVPFRCPGLAPAAWRECEQKVMPAIIQHRRTLKQAGTAGPSIQAPTGFWRLEEASGDRADSVASASLTPQNGGGGLPGNVAGKMGNAVKLLRASNSDAQHLISTSTTFQSGDIQFAWWGWVYFIDYTGDPGILTKGDYFTSAEYELHSSSGTSPARKLDWVVAPSGNFGGAQHLYSSTFGALSIGTWYFFACYHDSVGNQTGVGVNDVWDTVAYSSGITAGTGQFTVGARAINSGTYVNSINGYVDALAFFKNYLPSATEFTAAYNGGNGTEYYSSAWH